MEYPPDVLLGEAKYCPANGILNILFEEIFVLTLFGGYKFKLSFEKIFVLTFFGRYKFRLILKKIFVLPSFGR